MLIEILKHASSSLLPLNYNENKFYDNKADIIGFGNMPDSYSSTLIDTFTELESQVNITRQARNYAFHFAVNPSEEESRRLDDDTILNITKEYLERMNYGSQPFIVYKHRDISRVHYHCVTSRILPSGKLISTKFEKVRSYAICLSMQRKYGFVVGSEEKNKSKSEKPVLPLEEILGPRLRLTPEKPIREQIKAIVDEAHQFDYQAQSQFFAILEAFGFQAIAKKRKGGRLGVSGKGIDENGTAVTRLYAIDLMLHDDIMEDFRSHKEQMRAENRNYDNEDAFMAGPALFALENAHSDKEYKSILNQYGFDASIVRNAIGKAVDIVIVDKEYKRVNNISILEPNCDISRVNGWKKKNEPAEVSLSPLQKAKVEEIIQYKRSQWGLITPAERTYMRHQREDTEVSNSQKNNVQQIRLTR